MQAIEVGHGNISVAPRMLEKPYLLRLKEVEERYSNA
jgi:hypothetical protein